MTAEQALPLSFADGRAQQTDVLRNITAHLPDRISRLWNPAWRRVMLVGIGASYAALASPMQQLRRAGVLTYRTNGADFPTIATDAADVAVLVSQSGRSQETVALADRLQKAGISTLAITNRDHNPLAEVAGLHLGLGDQPDSRVSTVGFMITTAALGMLADYAAEGTVDHRWPALPDRMDAVTTATDELMSAQAGHFRTGAVDVVAPAERLTVAEAVALLFREGPLVPASAYDTRSYLHGPMDCAGSDVTHLLIGGDRENRLATQLRERTDRVLLTSDHLDDQPDDHWTFTQQALIEVGMLQGLVSATAQVRRNPVDDPVFVRQDTKVA
jgi:fructoselysine-6-P-deglycase FrlB-like protein